MGNKMKKLICALLASAMLVSSVGIVAFADADKNEDVDDTTITDTVDKADTADEEEPEETEAPVETTAPEATEAPVQNTGTAYDDDTYYQKSLALCSSLGIISGYEDGSVKPDSNVTRAEMASIVLRMLAISSNSKYQGSFTDVDASHWAADQIQTALEQGIVNGMGDGTFQPDGNVTYAQVIVMLVNAMNYTTDAEYNGGWQSGYITVANMTDLDLLNNAPGMNDEPSERGTVIKMAYNALLGSYKEINGYKNGAPVYEVKTDEDGNNTTLAKAKFNVKKANGVFTATFKTNISGNKMQEGQVEIQDNQNNYQTFDCKLSGLEEYLGQKVTYYYKDNTGLSPEILAVTYDAAKTEVVDIDADDVEKINLTSSGELSGIKQERVSKVKDCTGAKIIYNGKILSEVEKAEINAASGLDNFLKPEKGDIRLVDSDKDGVYDVVFVNSYEVMVITSATEDRLIGKEQKIGGALGETEAVRIDLDDEIDRAVTVTRNNTEVKLRNLKKNDVATIKRSYDNSVVDIIVTGESITGSATAISTKENKSYATIGGTKYDVANVAVGDLKTATQCVFYFDMFDRIAYIEGSNSGRLESGEKYGWLMEIYKDDASSDKIVKIMTQDGTVGEYKFASNVSYWAPMDLSGSKTMNKKAMEAEVERLLANPADNFPALYSQEHSYTGGYHSGYPSTLYSSNPNQRPVGFEPTAPITLVKYKANSSDALTKLYCAVNIANQSPRFYDPDTIANWSESTWSAIEADGVKREDFGWAINNNQYPPDRNTSETVKWYGVKMPYVTSAQVSAMQDSDALIINAANLSGSILSGGLLAGYAITDDAVEFGVPNDASRYNNEGSYEIAKVQSSKYNVKENGMSDTYFVAEVDGRTPAVIVKYIEDPDAPVNPGSFDTAGNTPSMIVDNVSMAIDDDDEVVYTINGYANGVETSVTTKRTSALSELTGYASDNRTYTTGAVLWEGKSGANLADYLHEGDIIITDGNTILLYACAEDIYNELKNNENADISKYVSGSETRNSFVFDAVTGSDVDTISWMSIGSRMISADTSMAMDVIEIDLSQNSFDKAVTITASDSTIADVSNYEDGEGDYAFARIANKGVLQEVVIYRITK